MPTTPRAQWSGYGTRFGGELMRQGGRMDRVKEQMVLIVRTQLPDEELVKLPVQPGVVTFVKLMPYWEAK